KLRNEIAIKVRADAEAQIEKLRERIQVQTDMEKQLKEEIDRLRESVRLINRGSLEIVTAQRKIEQLEEVAKRVAGQAEALRVESLAPERVVVFEEATVTQSDDTKKRLAATGVAGGSGLALVLFGMAWFELRVRRVNSVDEVIHGLGLNLMGTL